jgi:ribosomal protein L24
MFEYLVRPYQSPRSQGSVVIPSTPSAPSEKAVLKWGASATLPIQAKGINFNTACCKEQSDEQSRETEIVRIENPTDPSNYMLVERSKKLLLNKEEKNQCGDNWDQLSAVGLEITAELAFYEADITTGGIGGNDQPGQCKQTWNLKNNTTQPAQSG